MGTEISEDELVSQAVSGDEAAFIELASRYQPRVWSTASRFTKSRPETEDLVQDLFLKIWKGLPSFKQKSPFEHWLMKVTIRGCYDHLRKHRKRRERELLTEEVVATHSESGSTSRSLQRREAQEIVFMLLERLDAKDRTIVTLLELEEKSVREIAELTGWSESNVKVRAHRARKKMRTIFEELGLER